MVVAVVVQGILWVWAFGYLDRHGWPTFGEGLVNPYLGHLAFHSITYPLAVMLTPVLFSWLSGGLSRTTVRGLFDAFPNVLWSLPVVALGFKACLEGWIGRVTFSAGLPIWLLILQGALYLVLADLAFYVSHRALHLRPLYRFHKVHHTHRAPTEAIAFFALSATETFVSGLFTMFVPVLILPIHVGVWAAGASLILLGSCFIHDRGSLARSPRSLFLLNGPAGHQIHHGRGRRNVNFGLLFTTWDRVFGTYAAPE